MILAGTGHRPDKLPNKLTGYKIPNPTYDLIIAQTEELLLQLKPEKVISGMALGFDQYLVDVCIKLNIPFIAAVPFVGQERIWPKASQDRYNKLIKLAIEIKIVCDGEYHPDKLQTRNEWMVDNSDEIIACWNGSGGGTKNCIDYAKIQQKKIHYLKLS